MDGFSVSDIEAYASLVYNAPREEIFLEPYAYPIGFAAVAPGATVTSILRLSANADMIALGLSHFATRVGQNGYNVLSKEAPNVSALLIDTATGDPFTQQAANLELWSENGMGRNFFTFPRLLRGRGAINVQITNNDGEVTYRYLELMLHGVLVRSYAETPRSSQVAR